MIGHQPQLDFLSRLKWVPNSLIFAGPEGIGKKLVAKEFFAFMNRGLPQAEKALSQGDFEAFEVYAPEEGKKFFSVDQVREIVQKSERHPHPFKYRLFVLDRAEKLTHEAASALLKTLEDPPFNRCRFVLLTTSPNHLLPTIRSRSHLLQFYPLSVDQVGKVLRDLAFKDPEVLARISGGSPGKAIELASDRVKLLRSSLVSFFTVGSSLVVYSAFKFVDDLKAEDWPIINGILDVIAADLIVAKETGTVRFNKDFETEFVKRVSQPGNYIEALVKDIAEYLMLSERGLNQKLQLKNLLLSNLFFAKGAMLEEDKR